MFSFASGCKAFFCVQNRPQIQRTRTSLLAMCLVGGEWGRGGRWKSHNTSLLVFRCIGTIQHLKSKYGSGYILEVKQRLQTSAELQSDLSEKLRVHLESEFEGCTQAECFAERAVYKIPQTTVTSLARAFATMENGRFCRLSLLMCDISLSHTN